MCDPFTATMAALSGAAALFGGGGDKPEPPKPAPVIQETPAAAPNAEVRVGDGDEANLNTSTPEYTRFTEKRASGKALGNLGRSGLGL